MRFTVLVILLLIVGFINEAQAQFEPTAYRLGINANLPFVSNHKDTFSARTGWGLWGSSEFDIGQSLRFTPTLAYNNFGYSQNYQGDSSTRQRRKITEHYLDFVAELNYLPSPKSTSTRINFGMGVSVLSNRVTDQPDEIGRNITIRTVNNKKSFTPNFIANLGINAPLGKRVDLGIQYTISLPHKVHPLDVSGRLGTFQIKLGFKIIPSAMRTVDQEKIKASTVMPLSLYKKDSLIVIVRLKEKAKRIQYLKENGLYLDAEEERQNAFDDNMAIVEAFKEKFTLLPVYYFYDTDSKTILGDGFDGVLLNENLVRDSSFRLPKKEFIIAELGRQFDDVSQTSGMYGLVVLNASFDNIASPFPSFTSNAYGLLSTKEMIGKFQKRLYKYLTQ